MTCHELTSAINSLPPETDISSFFYQRIPGSGSYDPLIGPQAPNSLPEFNLLTAIVGWNESEFVGVAETQRGVSLFSTPDSAHSNDVVQVIPGSTVAVIGRV